MDSSFSYHDVDLTLLLELPHNKPQCSWIAMFNMIIIHIKFTDFTTSNSLRIAHVQKKSKISELYPMYRLPLCVTSKAVDTYSTSALGSCSQFLVASWLLSCFCFFVHVYFCYFMFLVCNYFPWILFIWLSLRSILPWFSFHSIFTYCSCPEMVTNLWTLILSYMRGNNFRKINQV